MDTLSADILQNIIFPLLPTGSLVSLHLTCKFLTRAVRYCSKFSSLKHLETLLELIEANQIPLARWICRFFRWTTSYKGDVSLLQGGNKVAWFFFENRPCLTLLEAFRTGRVEVVEAVLELCADMPDGLGLLVRMRIVLSFHATYFSCTYFKVGCPENITVRNVVERMQTSTSKRLGSALLEAAAAAHSSTGEHPLANLLLPEREECVGNVEFFEWAWSQLPEEFTFYGVEDAVRVLLSAAACGHTDILKFLSGNQIIGEDTVW
jgi:hypothetical protein